MYSPDTREKIERELQAAETARAAGNEGQARVCARRAAGAAAREFLLQRQQAVHSPSVIDLLQQLRDFPGLPERAAEVVDHLLTRVTPEFQLPMPADLLAETRWLADALEKLTGSQA